MNTETSLAEELIGAGFRQDAQKRGLFKWIIGLQFALIVVLIYALISSGNKARDEAKSHEEILHEIIKMQNNTQQKVDTTINKL